MKVFWQKNPWLGNYAMRTRAWHWPTAHRVHKCGLRSLSALKIPASPSPFLNLVHSPTPQYCTLPHGNPSVTSLPHARFYAESGRMDGWGISVFDQGFRPLSSPLLLWGHHQIRYLSSLCSMSVVTIVRINLHQNLQNSSASSRSVDGDVSFSVGKKNDVSMKESHESWFMTQESSHI